MTFSTQARHSLAFIPEAGFGEIPLSPTMKRLRHTGCDLTLSKKTLESDEIRDDRQIGHFIHSLQSVSGDIDFEMSFGAYDELLAAALFGNWDGNVLKTGTQQQSFTFERGFNDISQFQVYSGCVVDELNLSVQAESLVSGRFSIIGKQMSQQGVPLDISPSMGAEFAPMDSFKGSIKEGGNVLAHIAGIDLKIENDAKGTFVLGADSTDQIVAGRSRVSGELTAYFEDNSLINKFVNADASSLELDLSGVGGSYTILLPNILYTGAEVPVKGERVVTINLPFVALHDDTDSSNIKITRNAI